MRVRLLLVFVAFGSASAEPLDEVLVVTSRLREVAAADLPASVTVLSRETVALAGLQHFEDVLHLVPNLNWAAGSARPRYFQLRGVGELDQYQGAPNPSVGFLIDDIDYSGVGMPATTFDVEQVEVLRGPQGTAYGANALAGLIRVNTVDARPEFEVSGEATAGDTGTLGGGIVVGGSIGRHEDAAFRLVAHHYQSDGFRTNAYVGRDDTNGYNENTLRAKFKWSPADDLDLGLTMMFVDIADGYDAFSIDNSRTTLADNPGEDAQRSAAAAVRASWSTFETFSVRSITTLAQSDIGYGFDGDWGNDSSWGLDAPYDYTSHFDRERRTFSQDLRFVSNSDTDAPGGFGWAVGVYLLKLNEQNRQIDTSSGEAYRDLASDFAATSGAIYGEIDVRASKRTVWSAGLRAERRKAKYSDVEAISDAASGFAPTDRMWGGHLSVTLEETELRSWYATLSRGFKAGGFNIGSAVPADRREFAPEDLWNIETGVSWDSADRDWSTRAALFYMRRGEQQVATSAQLDPGDPLSYVFFTDNAARGENYGVEGNVSWRANAQLELSATFGLLESAYLDYRTGDPDRDAALDGRDQAHAPNYQYSLSAMYRPVQGLYARADIQGVDAFYFDTSHEERSEPFTVVNLRVGYEAGNWSASAWARNVFDEDYAMRGFFFGNEPPDFPNRRYVQQADGRQIGVTVTFNFE